MSDGMVQLLERGAGVTLEPELTPELLRRMFRYMVETRALDERGLILQRQGRLGFYLPSTGQEAAQIGSAAALTDEDWVVPSYRDQGVALWRGASADELFAQCFGNADDDTRGRQMPVHYSFRKQNFVTISSPIGTQIVHATGVAWAMQYRRDRRAVLTYLGDGATSSNDFHTGLNFAGVRRSPVVFFCNNNQWAISVPLSSQTASESIAVKARAYGFEGVRVDGNDVLAVYHVTRQAVEKARGGGGPTLIEAFTYRMGPHSSSDDPTRYRDEAELAAWKGKDPIERFRRFLTARGVLDEKVAQEIAETARAEMQAAAQRQEKSPPPSVEDIFTGVYREMPWHLREQMEATQAEGGHEADANAAFPL